MASNYLLLLVIVSCISSSLQDSKKTVEEDDPSPYADAVSEVLKKQNGQNLGAMFQNFLETEGANLLGDVLSNVGKANAGGQLLQGLGSLVGEEEKKSDGEEGAEDDSAANLLQGLGSLVGAFQGAAGGGGGDGAGDLLQGLGSLLGGQGGQGGIDPAVIGSLVNMFAQSQEKPKKSKAPKKAAGQKSRASKTESELDIGSLLSLASSFLGKSQGKSGQGSFLDYLPMIMQTIGSLSGPEAQKRAKRHEDHSWALPPLLEKAHVIFDLFIHSEMGKFVISALGAEKTFKVFEDEEGRFSYQKFGEMMENHSFRRHWIRLVTDRIAGFLHYASDPKVYKAYFASGQFFLNSYLKSQGFPKAAMFDPARPVQTITSFSNYVAKKYFEVAVDSKEYVEPAVAYIQDLFRLAENYGTLRDSSNSKELADKLADTINMEIIEPLARVNRAYRFAKTVPQCERYVLCLVNEENQNEVESLPGLKKLLYRGASLVAGWFLSAETGTPFWTLYTDIVQGTNCKKMYSDKCHDFHLEELRVTTEYVHNEL